MWMLHLVEAGGCIYITLNRTFKRGKCGLVAGMVPNELANLFPVGSRGPLTYGRPDAQFQMVCDL